MAHFAAVQGDSLSPRPCRTAAVHVLLLACGGAGARLTREASARRQAPRGSSCLRSCPRPGRLHTRTRPALTAGHPRASVPLNGNVLTSISRPPRFARGELGTERPSSCLRRHSHEGWGCPEPSRTPEPTDSTAVLSSPTRLF